jgi:hypothetical protein
VSLLILIFLSGWTGMNMCLTAQTRSQKRGLAYSLTRTQDMASLKAGVCWFYNWAVQPNASVLADYPDYDLDFVPMAWNGSFDQNALKAFLQSHPSVHYLLGFNEPNFSSQAKMKPSEAAQKWKILQSIADQFNLKLVAPAVNYCSTSDAVSENGVVYTDPVQYLDDFFKACPDCRVDYIAIHCYMNYASALQSYVARFKKYNKPVWLTEFCGWESGITPSIQRTLMVKAINYLENDPDVFRYAWFNSNSTGSPYMQLLTTDGSGTLTEMGKIYTNLSSYDTAFYFNAGTVIPACQYVRMNGILPEATTDAAGSIDIAAFSVGQWTDYNVNLPFSGNYTLSFRTLSDAGALLSVLVDGIPASTITITPAGTWNTQSAPVVLPSGKHTVRLQPASGNVNLNWWSVNSATSPVGETLLSDIRLFPNPVSTLLNVDLACSQYEVRVLNMYGQVCAAGHNMRQLDMRTFPGGFYVVQVWLPDGTNKAFNIIKK